MLFLDQPPLIPMELPRARLPSDERLWNATTAQEWREIWGQNGKLASFCCVQCAIADVT